MVNQRGRPCRVVLTNRLLFLWVKGRSKLVENINTMRLRKKQRGFTLIEATLAVVVLGIAAAGVLLPGSPGNAGEPCVSQYKRNPAQLRRIPSSHD